MIFANANVIKICEKTINLQVFLRTGKNYFKKGEFFLTTLQFQAVYPQTPKPLPFCFFLLNPVKEINHRHHDNHIKDGHAGAGPEIINRLIASGAHDEGIYLVGRKNKGV